MQRRTIRFVSACAAAVLVIALVVIWILADTLAEGARRDLLSGFVGGLAAALVTVAVGWVAWEQLSIVASTTKSAADTTSADFVLRLKQDFFQERTRTLVTLIANRWLRFVEFDADGNCVDIPYLEVRQDALAHARLPEEVREHLRAPGVYTAFEIDDLLLGPLDDVATLWEAETLGIEMVKNVFGWYVCVAWDDPDVKAYVEHQHRTEGADIYAALGRLRGQCS